METVSATAQRIPDPPTFIPAPNVLPPFAQDPAVDRGPFVTIRLFDYLGGRTSAWTLSFLTDILACIDLCSRANRHPADVAPSMPVATAQDAIIPFPGMCHTVELVAPANVTPARVPSGRKVAVSVRSHFAQKLG